MTSANGRFIQQIRLAPGADDSRYPFSLPAVRQLACSGALNLPPGVTFLVGENGSGKSTLIEAIAVAAGFNPEGGSRNFRFATRATESELGNHLILTWGIQKPRTDFFLRAESYYNVASEIERLNVAGGRPLLPYSTAGSPRMSAPTENRSSIWPPTVSDPGDCICWTSRRPPSPSKAALPSWPACTNLPHRAANSSWPHTHRYSSPSPVRQSWRSPMKAGWSRSNSIRPSQCV